MNALHWLTAPIRALWRWLAARRAPTLAAWTRSPWPEDRVRGEQSEPWTADRTALRDATSTRAGWPDNVREFLR